jgi:glutamine phosphoribosylpyrophosphate amidotransferase
VDLAERTFGDELSIEKLVDAEHPKALLFELVYYGRQQPVIANCTVTDSGEQLGGPPIRAQRAQRWAPDAAG